MNIDVLFKNVKEEFETSFKSRTSSDEKKFDFIKKYLRFYEELCENMNNVFFINNPILDSPKKKHGPSEIDTECIEFLVKKTKVQPPNYRNSDRKEKETARYKMKAQRGQAYALIGIVYELGAFSIPVNISRAVNFYITSSKLANPLGTYRLAVCFEKGKGRPISIEKSLVFYRCSAKLGGVEAMHAYGCILMNGGMGVIKQESSGFLFLKMAIREASDAYPYPYYDLATIYEDPGDFIDIWKDEDYAFELYMKGASLGCSNCLHRLGVAYEKGELNREPSIKETLFYFEKAASMFHIEAMYNMGLYYLNGSLPYIERDIRVAYEYAVKAATRHHLKAALLAAQIVENEPMFNSDPVMALWWNRIAESMGHSMAHVKIRKLVGEISKRATNLKSPSGCKVF